MGSTISGKRLDQSRDGLKQLAVDAARRGFFKCDHDVGVFLFVAALIAGPSLGQLGGKARIKKITPEKRQEIARNAARARRAKERKTEIQIPEFSDLGFSRLVYVVI